MNCAPTPYTSGISTLIVMTWLHDRTGERVLVAGVVFHLMLDLSSSTLLADLSFVGMTEGIPPIMEYGFSDHLIFPTTIVKLS